MLRAAAVLALILAGCGGGVADVARDPAGRPTEAGTVRADRIRVGDCFDDQASRSVAGFPVVPCEEPHDNEVFHAFDVTGGRYPGQGALTDLAAARCIDAFAAFVGRPYEGSALDVFQVLPTRDTWEDDGDRQVVCALYARDRRPLRGSMRGTAR